MNKLKRILVVILSILLVLVSIVAWAGSALRFAALNPIVYSKLMPTLNAFDSLYEGFVDYLLDPLNGMEIPEELVGVPEDIVRTTITKEDFNNTIGEFVGGAIGMLLYKQEEVIIPIEEYVDKLYTAIENDPRILNSDTNIKATMDAINKYRLENFVFEAEGYDQTLTGLVTIFLQQNAEYWLKTFFPYWGMRLSVFTFASLGAILVLFILLMILNTERRYRSIKLAKILCVVYGILNLLAAGFIYLLPNMAVIIDKIAPYEKYIYMAKTIFNSFAYIAIAFAVVLIIAAIILGKYQKKAYAKMPSAY